MASQDKLMIGVLGGIKSGKTHTWNLLFNKKSVKTGRRIRRLFFDEVSYIDVFLISRSAQKRKMDVQSIIRDEDPQIVLCSLQYAKKLSNTLKHFVDNGYMMYLHWLNPGFKEPHDIPLFYDSDLVDYILSVPSMLGVRNGKANAGGRVNEIRDFLYAWAKARGLIQIDEKKLRKIQKAKESAQA
jgi:dephospho-CoA kinase